MGDLDELIETAEEGLRRLDELEERFNDIEVLVAAGLATNLEKMTVPDEIKKEANGATARLLSRVAERHNIS